MNDSERSSFIPVLLLSLALIALLGWEVIAISRQRSALHEARDNMEKAASIVSPKQEEMVTQSKAIQENLEKLVFDVLSLAKTDKDAAAIVAKYDIKQAAPAEAAEPSPTP